MTKILIVDDEEANRVAVSEWLVAATKIDVAEKVEVGEFREDLFYRLTVN